MTEISARSYSCLPRKRIESGGLSIETLQPHHIQSVRGWRNEQMDVLRQSAPISAEQQEAYFATRIWPQLDSPQPDTILLAFNDHGRFIGYGGLVHIAWEHRRAEISFLLKTALAGTDQDHGHYFPAFIELMKTLAFDDLKLERLCTETYVIRPDYLAALDAAGFVREGILRRHVVIDGRPEDAVLHGFLRSDAQGQGTGAAELSGNILVTSASKKAPLIRAMQEAARRLDGANTVVAGDMNPNALTRYVAQSFWQMPPAEDTSLGDILAGCTERDIRTIFPTRDGELPFFARHRDAFAKAGIAVIVSPLKSVSLCLDKLAFAKFGEENGLPTIPTLLRPDTPDCERFVVKERYGAGSKSIGIGLDRDTALEHGRKLMEAIYQPYVEGREISVDAWCGRDGNVKGLVLRTRELVSNGESQITTTFKDDRIERVARGALEALKLCGPAVLQILIDEAGGLHIVECNPRFGGASTASIEAGLDMLYWSLLERSGGDASLPRFERADREIRQVRVPADTVFHGPDF